MFPHTLAVQCVGYALGVVGLGGFIFVLNRAAVRPLGARGKGRLFLCAMACAALAGVGLAVAA